MKFCVKKSVLAKCLQFARRVANGRKRQNLALLEADENRVRITVVDSHIKMRQEIPGCRIESAGRTTASMKKMSSLVTKVKGEEVEVEARNAFVKMKSESAELNAEEGVDTNGFEINHLEGKALVETDGIAFSDALKRVAFAAGGKDNWRRLDVVNIAPGESFIELTATDGCRLATAKIPVSGNLGTGIVIPVESAKKIGAILSSNKKLIMLGVTDASLHIESEGIEFTVEKVYTQFPDYKSVIPQDYKNTFTVNADKLLEAIKKLPLTRDSSLTVEFNQGAGVVYPYNEKAAAVQIEGKYSGEEISISLRSKFVVEMLKVVGKEQLKISVRDKNSPVVITAGDNYLYAVMPIVEEEAKPDVAQEEEQKPQEASDGAECEEESDEELVAEGSEGITQ
jgi:DNA polymerase III beta subunit